MEPLRSITKSKIICTMGPSTSTVEQIRKLAKLGMDCARINFSHGTPQEKEETFGRIRKADPTLAILCDIQGPKIRLGRIKDGGVLIHPGHEIKVTTKDILGDEERIPILYGPLPKEVKPGDYIFISDGIICLEVKGVKGGEIHCKILAGGFVSDRKGVNLPHTKISACVPTEKDRKDLKLIAKLNPEYVAASFVSCPEDILAVKDLLAKHGNEEVKLIAKIERPMAVENFDPIMEVSDAVMVARGDLGVELAPEDVLPAQKMMIRKCNVAGKPIIVATQMLESMVKSPVPTRAEVSDVYNAIEDGADCVMLSAETAAGDYPDLAVAMMERIIRLSESLMPKRDPDDYDSDLETTSEILGHLVFNACKEFDDMRYEKGKVVCLTSSGNTARMISKYRPTRPILAITSNDKTAKELRIVGGVEPLCIPELERCDTTIAKMKQAVKFCIGSKYVDANENLIITGNIFDRRGQTNSLSILQAKEVRDL